MRLERLLASFKTEQPAHTQLVSAFTPVFLMRERLIPADAPEAGQSAAPLQSAAVLPVDTAEAHAVALPLLDALALGFPAAAGPMGGLARFHAG